MGSKGDRGRPWTVYAERGIAYLNTRIAGRRIRESLQIEYDPATASAGVRRAVEHAAAERYAKLVSGRVLTRDEGARVLTSNTLTEALALHLVEAKLLYPKSFKTRAIQLRNALDWAEAAPRFEKDARAPIERLWSDEGPQDFATDRLQQVVRSTVQKEISPLFAFLEWAVNHKMLSALPRRPKLPRGARGVRSGPQREEPVQITHEEALQIIASMPEHASRGSKGTKRRIIVRDFARFLYETGLRPGAVQRLQVPRDWAPGSKALRVHANEDKALYGRTVALTKAAQAILEEHAQEPGVVFGVHDLRAYFKAAALTVLPAEKAAAFARYDLRHGAIHLGLAVGGSLPGVAQLAGHRRITTTNRYVRANEQDGAAVVNARDAVSSQSAGPETAPEGVCASISATCRNDSGVRRRGLEPLRFYPLAPQASAYEQCPDLSPIDLRQATAKYAGESTGDDAERSARGQQLAELQRGLAFELVLWDAFDRFSFAEGDE